MTTQTKCIFLIFSLFFLMISVSGCIGNLSGATGFLQETPGNTFYVSSEGDNANPGSREKPWATPGYGSRQLKAGDTLIIVAGKYELSNPDTDIVLPPSGTSSSWTTIRGENENSLPVLIGKNNCPAAIDLSGKSFVRMANLEITGDEKGTFQDGIRAMNSPVNNCTFLKIYIHKIYGKGIFLPDAQDVVFDQCNIEYCGSACIDGSSGKQGGWKRILIRKCVLTFSGHFNQENNPKTSSANSGGIWIEKSEGPVEIVETRIEHNLGDGIRSQAKQTIIRQCIIANNSHHGINLEGDKGTIENTLVYGTGDGDNQESRWVGINILPDPKSDSFFDVINVTLQDNPERQGTPLKMLPSSSSKKVFLTLRNSIIAGGYDPISLSDDVNLRMENSIIYQAQMDNQIIIGSNRKYGVAQIEKGELGKGNLGRDPLFVAPAWGKNGNFHVKNTSSALNSGTSSGAPSVDIEGRTRPQGSAFDIGAYEEPVSSEK